MGGIECDWVGVLGTCCRGKGGFLGDIGRPADGGAGPEG
jgi:hypothetical protein